MKKTLALAAIFISALFILSACGGGSSQLHGIWVRWDGDPQVYEFRRGAEGFWGDGRIISCDCYYCAHGRVVAENPSENLMQALMRGSNIWGHTIYQAPMDWNESDGRIEIGISLLFCSGDYHTTYRTYYFELEDDDTLIIWGINEQQGAGSVLTRLD
ncbi:MAG: hypothetical protein FWC76_07200 [Defluviitaleaceae bacterium]|nr:hypothetical protein [Defluviitaleaceae bacterium]